ncbi:MAG TPA: DUF6159 family protein [Gaiellaceae bacterium]|nr:DUF6159 family protein [Gaiellaceae bacterium]
MGVLDGTKLMRDSLAVVRANARLLWFPVISTVSLALIAGFWILWGTSLYDAHGTSLLLVPLVVAGLYSLSFVAVFFSVALAGTASEAVEGSEPSVGDGIDIAFDCLGAIAGWAAMSLFVGLLIGLVKSSKGLRLLGTAAQVAWSFATLFVVPLIAMEDIGAEGARRRSFQLSKENWQAESGGLVALRAALLIPGVIMYGDWKLLASGHVNSIPGKALLLVVLLCGIAVSVAASVVRQVFAVTLYRDTAGATAA